MVARWGSRMSKVCVCVWVGGGGGNCLVLKRSTFVCICVSFFPLLMMIRDAPKGVCVGVRTAPPPPTAPISPWC